MVMRNRHDETGSPGWWDDLPPKVRARFGARPSADLLDAVIADPDPPGSDRPAGAAARTSVFDWVRELSRLALLFLAIAIGNLVFLLVALSFLAGSPPVPFVSPAR